MSVLPTKKQSILNTRPLQGRRLRNEIQPRVGTSARGLMSRSLAKIRDRLRGRENDIPLSLPILQGRWKSTYPHLCRFYKDGGNGNPLISADSTRMVETATHSSLPIPQGRWKSTYLHLCRFYKDGGKRHTSISADPTRTVEIDIPPSLPILQGRWKSTYPHLWRFYRDSGNGNKLIFADSTRTMESTQVAFPTS